MGWIRTGGKKVSALLLLTLILVSMAGCGKYTSSYKATLFVHSNNATTASMSFHTFEGRMVFKMKSSGEGELKYTASLESGNATVYYDYIGSKTELFSVSGGDELDDHGGYIEAGTVYVIVETDGKCQNGEISITIE